ncbi:aminoacyltransferase [Staphylococcus rostri]|uniref:Aminoacyltransferase FemA n=1 Tax=Staphylococcus rostri TaxID=522262 RepID=A0A2K3YWS7_9STAP|nr:aminoacyltransferase [Staphylococcus rostri]PNZ30063.1 aminoacyltransferase [Staphylococcus rostri]
MKFTNLTEDEYAQFVNERPSHFTQSVQRYQADSNTYLVGVKDDEGNVIAACLLTASRTLKFFKYFYTQRGPVMDFQNTALVHFFFKNLTKYLKKLGGLYVRVDPYVVLNKRTADGEIVTSYDHRAWFNTMEQLGYTHQGYTTGIPKVSQVRWLSVLDMQGKAPDQILKEMDYQTRRNIKKTYEMGVKVRTLSIDETDRFYKLNQMAEEKHNFTFRNFEFFKNIQRIYGDNITLKLAYIDLNEYKQELTTKLANLENDYQEIQEKLAESPNSKKNKTKATQLTQQLQSTQRKLDDTDALIASDGPILDLAAAVFIFNHYEMYYLSSGSNPKYNAYMGAYRLQWEMMNFAKERNIDRYNFYGITGVFNETADDYGVQQFKKGFNAHVEEYVGDFIKPLRPLLYRLVNR